MYFRADLSFFYEKQFKNTKKKDFMHPSQNVLGRVMNSRPVQAKGAFSRNKLKKFKAEFSPTDVTRFNTRVKNGLKLIFERSTYHRTVSFFRYPLNYSYLIFV
jgi:hypothetical protein